MDCWHVVRRVFHIRPRAYHYTAPVKPNIGTLQHAHPVHKHIAAKGTSNVTHIECNTSPLPPIDRSGGTLYPGGLPRSSGGSPAIQPAFLPPVGIGIPYGGAVLRSGVGSIGALAVPFLGVGIAGCVGGISYVCYDTLIKPHHHTTHEPPPIVTPCCTTEQLPPRVDVVEPGSALLLAFPVIMLAAIQLLRNKP